MMFGRSSRPLPPSPPLMTARELLFSSDWSDWLTWGVSLVLVLLTLYLLGLFWVWLGFLVVALLLAVAFQVLVERKLEAQRRGPIGRVGCRHQCIRESRRGVPECQCLGWPSAGGSACSSVAP